MSSLSSASSRSRSSSSPRKSGLVPFHVLLKKKFRHQHDMRKLILTALMDPYKDPIVRLLADEQGAQQLSKILSAAYILDAGNTAHLFSFQRVAVPLCFLLSHADFTHSVRASDLSRIYHHVFNHKTFFMRYVNVLEILLVTREGDVTDARLRAHDPSEYHPSSALDCATPFLNLCLAICRVVYQARTDCLWENVMPTVRQAVESYILATNDTGKGAQQMLQKIDRLNEISTTKERYINNDQAVKNLPKPTEASESELKAFVSQGPGSQRAEGPRHDNDFEGFRSIQVLPTEEEITCLISPYLPFQSGSLAKASNSWVKDDIECHLDSQFRLMREDMIAPLRSAIHHFFLADVLSTLSKTKNHFSFGEDHHSQGSCLLLRNVQVADVVASHTHGALIRLEFDQIFPAVKEKDRDIAWNFGYGSRLLQPNSIVCIALDVKVPTNPRKADENPGRLHIQAPPAGEIVSHVDIGGAKLVFAYVHHEGRNKLGRFKDRCSTLHIQSVAFKDNSLLIDALVGKKSRAVEGTTNVLLQVRGHFVAGTVPVLNALQKASLKGHPLVSKLLDKKLVRISDAQQDFEGSSPNRAIASYISSATRYDLSFLVEEQFSKHYPELEDVVVNDFDALLRVLYDKENEICLDQNQIESFVSGLVKDVAMIQGPPGCGKTYIGVKIMQALLRNSSGVRNSTWSRSMTGIRPPGDVDELKKPHIDPILCICYTNHALDQFLSALLDTGCVGLSEIVRVGSMSKNDALKSRSLESMARATSGFNQRRDIALIRSQCSAVENELGSHINRMKSMKENEYCFSQWLQETNPEFYREVVSGRSNSSVFLSKSGADGKHHSRQRRDIVSEADYDDEGFQLVGNFSSALNRWIWGKGEQLQAERVKKIEVLRAEYEDRMRVKMKNLFEDLQKWFQMLTETKNVSRLACLRRARVIGCTTTGAAKYNDLLQALAPAVIICEEAAEVLESHILSSMSARTKQLILIGDHLQLRPKVSEYRLSQESGFNHDLDISLFERIARDDICSVAKLKSQRRMHPTISQIPRETMYPYLLDSPSVFTLPEQPRGFQKPLFFVSHRHPEPKLVNEQTKSFSNVHEVKFVCALARYVIRQGYEPHQIAIITPYVGQLLLFREMLMKEKVLVHIDELDLQDIQASGINIDNNSDNRPNAANVERSTLETFEVQDPRGARLTSLKDCLRLSTVDNFQGEEAEIVLVSTVRCNDQGNVGFLKFSNRVNVMLTRAKHGMYIIGSAETIRSSRKAKTFHTVLDLLSSQDLLGPTLPLQCQNHGNTFFASTAEGIPADGGCNIVCGARKSCGHRCRRRCHPDDRNHLIEDCMEECPRLIPNCGHPCRRLCYQECGNCDYPVHIVLPCGHELDSVCKKKKEIERSFKCMEIVGRSVQGKCGHFNDIRCWEADKYVCRKICGGTRKCGHICKNLCFECPVTDSSLISKEHTGVCKQKCSRVLLCGHICNSSPCHDSKSCPPCSSKECLIKCEHSNCPLPCSEICFACCEPCSWRCTCGSQRSCLQLCATPCVRLPCDSRCSATLECGHQCPSVCGEQCPSKEYCPTCAKEKKKYTTKTGSQIVDFVTLETLEQLVGDDDEHTPIIILPCGHVFTVDTLDRHMDMKSFYRKDSDQKWCSVIDLEELKSLRKGPYDPKQRRKPQCILCKSDVNGINRYKRITTFHDMVVTQRKWVVLIQEKYDFIANAIDRLGRELRELSGDASEEQAGSHTNQSSNRVHHIYKQAQQQALKARELFIGDAENGPTAVLHRMEMAKSIRENNPLPKGDFYEMKPDPLPKLLAMEATLKSTLLNARIVCYYITKNEKDGTGTKLSERNNEPKNVGGLQKQVTQLTETSLLRKQARNEFDEIMRYCSANKYERRRIALVKMYALGLYELYSDLDRIGFNYQPEVPSTVEQKTDCAWELEELGKICPDLKDLANELLDKLSCLCYKPVTREERRMVFHALARDVGSGIGGFGGHYYRCPNGHTYAIGDCGGAVMESRCPECGATIGGLGHRLSQGNSIDPEFRRITFEEGNTYN